ncbi:MAG: hypothetical protein U0790_02975 [Isosphaeraceae bacterium]
MSPRHREGRRHFSRARILAIVSVLVVASGGVEGRGKEPAAKAAAPTYARDILPILRKSCTNCHRRGQVGPFPLESYEQARKRAFDIATVAADRSMPPWQPVSGKGPKLKHDPSLTPGELALLEAWAEAGAPRGEARVTPAVAAAAPAPGDGWMLGTPDLVLEMPEDFTVPATGPDLYRCFVIPTNLRRDAHVSAVEYLPGNRKVVHHLMAFLDSTRSGRDRDAAEPGPGYTSYSGAGVAVEGDLGGWAAGNVPHHLPNGIGRQVPAQSDILLQVHYHPSGKPEVDRTRIGLYFSKSPVRQTLHWANATNDTFRLKPGEPNTEVKACWSVPVDVDALGVTPHMHQLGKDFRMVVALPGGKTQELLRINAWNPNWQNTYYFEKPVHLPRGSTVKLIAHFDNSAHPRNPHSPPKLVTWGPEVTDEMCVGYIGVVKSGQDLTRPAEKDDLFDILARQYFRKVRSETAARSRR